VVKDYGLAQEYITPYTPQQNGLCERFIKTFKEEHCWTRRFQSIEHARLAVRAWIDHYNNDDLTNRSNTSHPPNSTKDNANWQPE
jgi:putative transposase